MITALNAASSGMEAQMAQIESISNNLANVNTTAFKKGRTEFQDLLYETLQEPGANTSALTQAPVGIQRGMGVKVSGTQRYFEMGHPTRTHRDLDTMINGEGFFVIQLPNGQYAYKRDGTFYKSAQGRLETTEGYPIQPEIIVPPNTRRVEIGEEGAVFAYQLEGDKIPIGQFQLASFINPSGLKSMGKNIFLETDGSGKALLSYPGQERLGTIMQGYLESSNVDVVKEMTDMISTQRAFEMNSKVVQSVDQILQHTVNVK